MQNIMEAIREIGKLKDIDPEIIISATEEAMAAAVRKVIKSNEHFTAKMDRETGQFEVFSEKTIVEEIEDPEVEMSLEEAADILEDAQVGDVIQFPRQVEGLGRIAAQTAKQVIFQRVREAERENVFEQYSTEVGKLLSGIVRRMEFGNLIISVGKTEAILPKRFQVRRENFSQGDRIKAVVVEVEAMARGPQIVVSRTDARLVSSLFALEVPEIKDGIVTIRAAVREPGDRSKIAVYSTDSDVDAVGACVGMKGYRVQNVMRDLGGEKIDIVPWSNDTATLMKNALSPARVSKIVIVDSESKHAEVIVPENQLSLAIGRGGQNVRLAAQLLGWKIDIRSEGTGLEVIRENLTAKPGNAAAQDAPADDLGDLRGVGAATVQNLQKSGYQTFAKLASASVEELSKVPGLGTKSAEKILEAAKARLEAPAEDAQDAPETGDAAKVTE